MPDGLGTRQKLRAVAARSLSPGNDGALPSNPQRSTRTPGSQTAGYNIQTPSEKPPVFVCGHSFHTRSLFQTTRCLEQTARHLAQTARGLL
jgi:hypothetical protein